MHVPLPILDNFNFSFIRIIRVLNIGSFFYLIRQKFIENVIW